MALYLRHLTEATGYSWHIIAIASQVPSACIAGIILAEKGWCSLYPDTISKLMALTPDLLLKMGTEPTPIVEISSRYENLRKTKLSHVDLARHCRLNVRDLSALLAGDPAHAKQSVRWALQELIENRDSDTVWKSPGPPSGRTA